MTGGSAAEVIEEAHLDEAHILAALGHFAAQRPGRLRRLRERFERPRACRMPAARSSDHAAP
jgi:hypothetical protein